jgi:hypothetical protein
MDSLDRLLDDLARAQIGTTFNLLGYAATRSAAARYPDSSYPAWQKKLR